ncbi:MAG TPA: hypothetical protein VMM93_12095 [Vicinamibacterales bacterium]|nr:hypothetical protein [Vicinamibacterales bacterium]
MCHYQRRCQREGRWCLGEITLEEVVEAVDRRLAAVRGPGT